MTEQIGITAGHELDERFRATSYAEHLETIPRWTRYMPEGITREEWRHTLHADSDGLDQARLMLNLTRLFLRQDTNNTVGLTDEEKELLMKAMAAQNWGKSYDDEHVSRDISYEFITSDDVEHRIRKFHTVYQELVPEASVKERFIVEKAIYDRSSKLGKVFDAVRRLNCLRTGLIAYDAFIDSDIPSNQHLGALSLGVLANQLVPLIGYAEDFVPVKNALAGVADKIDTIFANPHLRKHPFMSTQSAIDSTERAEMIWNRSYREDSPTYAAATARHETIFSPGSAFEKRFVEDKEALRTIVEGLRAAGMTIALTSGSFDLLHVGHAAYIERASEFADVLVLGVDSDAKIRKRKGESRPIVNEEERVRLLSHLRGVGLITLKEPNEERWGLIKLVHPDVLVVTAETYEPHEIRELEGEYCERVVVLEPQATTSTGAQIRKIEIGAAQRSTDTASAIGERVASILSDTLPGPEKLTAIQALFSDEKV